MVLQNMCIFYVFIINAAKNVVSIIGVFYQGQNKDNS